MQGVPSIFLSLFVSTLDLSSGLEKDFVSCNYLKMQDSEL